VFLIIFGDSVSIKSNAVFICGNSFLTLIGTCEKDAQAIAMK